MIRWEERQRDGTGISHLGERKEEEGLVQSWVEEKCGHLVLSCSVSFLLGGFVLSNLASASASGAGAKSAVPPPLVAATYCLFPLPPARRRRVLRQPRPLGTPEKPNSHPRAALQRLGCAPVTPSSRPRVRLRCSDLRHALLLWWDSSANLWHRPAVLTRPSPHLIAAQHRSLLRFPVRRRCRAGPPPIGSPPPPPREPAFDGMGARSTL